MIVKIRRVHQFVLVVLVLSSLTITFEGCSTVHVVANQASLADDTYKTTVWALWWGVSDPVESVDCNGDGLKIVSMKTNWIYSLCTVVTLGAVVPMDIEYRCTLGSLDGGDVIDDLEEGIQ
jgi:hypothetical protein